MKDYSIGLEEKKDFILGFDVDGKGKMIVKFADGVEWPLPYNETNVNLILNKMREQVVDADKFIEIKKKEKEKFITYTILSFGVAAIMGVLGLSIFNIPAVDVVSYGLAGVLAVVGICNSYRINHLNLVLKDLKKNKWFLDVEDKLNKSIRKEENVLINISKYTKETIQGMPENIKLFDINSFNYVPFKDLEQIMDNVSRNERFGFDYTSDYTLQERPKTKKRKI